MQNIFGACCLGLCTQLCISEQDKQDFCRTFKAILKSLFHHHCAFIPHVKNYLYTNIRLTPALTPGINYQLTNSNAERDDHAWEHVPVTPSHDARSPEMMMQPHLALSSGNLVAIFCLCFLQFAKTLVLNVRFVVKANG